MIITGITKADFEDAVAKAGTAYSDNLVPSFGTDYSATRFSARVVLRTTGYQMGLPTSELAPGQRRSWEGRRAAAVCWHGYRDVLRELFMAHPDARVYTAMAKYKGLEGFMRNYPQTADRNIGSAASPVTMPETCDCPIGLRWEQVFSS